MKNLLFLVSMLFAFNLYSQNDGLVAFFPFNGNCKDSINPLTKTQVIGAILDADRKNAPNSAYFFKETDNFIKIPYIPNSDICLNAHASFFVWLKAESKSGNILTYNSNKEKLGLYLKEENGESYLYAKLSGTNPFMDDEYQTFEVKSKYLYTNKWCLVGFTYYYCSGILTLYINGEPVVTKDTENSDVLDTKHDIIIGGDNFKGTIDEIRFYNYSLEKEEVKKLVAE